MDILFLSTRYGNQFLPTSSLTPQSISMSTTHGVNENYCATIMRSWVVIAIALWYHGWVELIKGIKGDHCCCRLWLCKIRAGWQSILVNDKVRKKESRKKELYLRNDGIHRDVIQKDHMQEAMLKHIGQDNDNGVSGLSF